MLLAKSAMPKCMMMTTLSKDKHSNNSNYCGKRTDNDGIYEEAQKEWPPT